MFTACSRSAISRRNHLTGARARALARSLTGAAIVLAAGAAQAVYPEHPIKVIVPFPAGGPTDAVARMVSQQLSEVLGQPVVLDNRGGAGGVIATEAAAAAPADGYTLLFGTTGVLTINPSLYKNFRTDIAKSFVPVGGVGATVNVLVVPADSPMRTMQDVLAQARAKPGSINYGSAGNGSSNHLSGELLRSMTNIDIVHVPYKGSAAAMTDLLGGRVSMMFDVPLSVTQHVASGKLRVLGGSGLQRTPTFPDVPTISESGVPGYEVVNWFGYVAPRGTPRPVVDALNAALQKALASDNVRKQMDKMGITSMAGTPEQLGTLVTSETAKWAKVIKQSGATID